MRLASILSTLVLCPLGVATVACGGDSVAVGDYKAYRVASSEAKVSGDCFSDDPSQERSTNFRSGGTLLIYNAPEGDEDEFYLDLGALVFPGTRTDDGTYEFEGTETEIEIVGTEILDADGDGIPDEDQDPFVDEDGDGIPSNDGDPFIDADNDGLDDSSVIDDPEVDVDGDGIDDRQDPMVDQDSDGQDDRIVFTPSDTKYTVKTTYTVELTPDGGKVIGTQIAKSDSKCSGSLCGTFPATTCKQTTEFVGVEIEPESVSVPVGSSEN